MLRNVKSRVMVAGAAATAFASSALAGGPPSMPAVTFPVDVASVGTAISTAGGTILLAVFGVAIAFILIRKLFRRVSHAV